MEETHNLTERFQSESINEEMVSYSKIESIFAYIVLILGFCFVRFVVWNVTGVFTTVFFLSTAFACLFYLKSNHYKLYKIHILQFALMLIFSCVFFITANYFIKFLNVLFILLLGIYWVYSVCKENRTIERFFFYNMIKAVFIMPFVSFGSTIKVILHSTNKSQTGNTIKLILIGLVTAIPLTVVIIMLLTSADSGVEKILNALFGNIVENSIILVLQLCVGIPVAFYIFGMLYSNVRKIKKDVLTNEECEKKLRNKQIFPNIVMYSAITPICILYLIFFISQLQYFISAFNGVLPTAYSYAQYARRGFFELFAIALINLMVLMVINYYSRQTGENKPVMLKGYSILLSIFTILIIATALSKMIMYIGNYGLTPLRIYASWFMILLAILFVLIMIVQFKVQFHLAKYAVIAFVLLFGILCFSNVDGNIAKYNIEMYQAGKLNDLDIASLSTLSDDALVRLLEEEEVLPETLTYRLDAYKNNPYETYNLSSWKVKKLLEER